MVVGDVRHDAVPAFVLILPVLSIGVLIKKR